MKYLFTILLFALVSTAQAVVIDPTIELERTVRCTSPTHNTDGTEIDPSLPFSIQFYKAVNGVEYLPDAIEPSCATVVDTSAMEDGEVWRFKAIAIVDGVQSELSLGEAEIEALIKKTPLAPTEMRVE